MEEKRKKTRKMWLDNAKDGTWMFVNELLDSTQNRTQWRRVVSESSICALRRLTLSKDLMMMNAF